MTAKACTIRVVSQQFRDRTNATLEGIMAHLRDDNAKEILGPGLSPLIGRQPLESIVTFALYADVLRMVYDVLAEYGEISDEELQESLGLLSVIAAGFAKVPKEYASCKQLTSETGRHFLSQYESDAGLFGYANEETEWVGTGLCRNISSQFSESGPLEVFLGLLDHLTDHTLLTKEIAEVFIQSSGELSLDEFTAIMDDAAEVLSLHQGELTLDSVTHVSVEALTALSKHRGCVHFRGLVSISKDQAKVLAGFLSGIEVPIEECDPEVRAILVTHPSFRIHNSSELTEWLLEKLKFDEDVDSGRSWVSEEVMGVLLDVCACWQSADAANGVEMTGSDLDEILTTVKAAGTQEIHVVRLVDNDQSVFMFVGTVEAIKNRLLPIASCENKKNPVDDDDDDEQQQQEDG